ncbi:MAG TPA: phage portal protein [Fusobacterium sp.]|uniref:phage portal protein n=1 Tax=Fusobacterium sp. TaxID=68766 RepID=UPI002F414C3A
MNLIEKVITTLNPERALKREVARRKLEVLNTGYSNHGASTTKTSMMGWNSTGGGVKKDIYKNRKKLVERSRDLYMGAPIARGVLNTMNSNIIGSGLKLKSSVDYEVLGISEDEAERMETLIEKEFNLWAKDKIEQQGLLDFFQVQDLVFLTLLLNGEAFVKLNYFETIKNPYSLKLQIIEPDRIFTPNNKQNDKTIIEGVKIDSNGRIEGYYIAKEHPLDSMGQVESVYVSVFGKEKQRNILHILFSERPEQIRGIPILSPVIEALKQLDRYTEAELMAAVVSGLYAVFIESPSENLQGANIADHEVIDDSNLVNVNSEETIELSPGMVVGLNPGEKANSTNPGRPNAQFDPFVTAILRQIGTALEVPYELLIKHFTASYSASRAALLEAWKMFRKRREWFSSNFTQIIYEEWLREAYLLGRIELEGYGKDSLLNQAWSSAQWNGPSQGQIDPLKEAKASVLKIQQGLSTRTKETVELSGGDFEQNVRILAKEQKLLKEKGVVIINAKEEQEVLESREERN